LFLQRSQDEGVTKPNKCPSKDKPVQYFTYSSSVAAAVARHTHILSGSEARSDFLPWPTGRLDNQAEEYDRPWKIKTVFDTLNQAYAKFYNPSHLAVDKVTVKFKGRVIFRQYISKKSECFDIRISKLCDESGYTYDMREYLGTDSCSDSDDMTATHAWRLASRTITRKQICVNSAYVYVCGDRTVIKGATDLVQQPELCE
jgi:hypothetical protein